MARPVCCAACVACAALLAAAGARPAAAQAASQVAALPPSPAAVAKARADSARLPYTAADVRFMTAMIGHHAQAITMARLAPSRGASEGVRTLAARIINAQRDEIGTMRQWLRERLQPVPAVPELDGAPPAPADDEHAGHDTSGHDTSGHDMAGMGDTPRMAGHALMPGMLTPAQMAELEAARGREFDRLFLQSMIQHHRGATGMVRDLFATPGAGQDEVVFKFASDVNVDQTTEIARMQRMLAAVLFGAP